MSEDNNTDKGMKTPLTISAMIHIGIILLVIFGLPHFMKEPDITDSIPVEMVSDISDKTTTNKPPVQAPKPKEEKKEPPPPKKEMPPKQVTPKESTPPDPKELKEPPKDAVVKDDLAPPKPKDDKKPEKKVEEKKTPPKPDKKKDDAQDFNKLLQNLADEKPPAPDTKDEDHKLMTDPSPAPTTNNLSDKLTVSEQDALRQQLAGCWNINPGLMDAKDLAVEVRVTVNPDRTVSSAQIVDQNRYNSDTFFRTMADSALRAVRNPQCSPLRLPEDKYNLWKDMTIVFDPKEMF